MSKPEHKWYDNLQKVCVINNKKYQFYCDHACIHCFVCQENSADNFKSSEDGDHSYVFKQPENEEELRKCLDAMECCPVEAIGFDGYLSDEVKHERE